MGCLGYLSLVTLLSCGIQGKLDDRYYSIIYTIFLHLRYLFHLNQIGQFRANSFLKYAWGWCPATKTHHQHSGEKPLSLSGGSGNTISEAHHNSPEGNRAPVTQNCLFLKKKIYFRMGVDCFLIFIPMWNLVSCVNTK